ncbi:MAG: helical backbone metal receptor, partial [Myxococcota bacterium]
MSRVGLLNAAALAVALGTSLWLARAMTAAPSVAPSVPLGTHPGVVVDGGGHPVPVRGYARLVSASPLADQVYAALLEPGRLVAVTRFSKQGAAGYRFAGARSLARLEDLEAVLALEPDLVLVSGFADTQRVARLREAGLQVFDVGRMTGVASLLAAIRRLAAVVDVPERGEALARRWLRRFRAVAADVAEERRARGAYVGLFGDRLYGGTAGSSYADVLDAAGVDDVAAAAGYTGWPELTREQLLALDPPLLVAVPSCRSSTKLCTSMSSISCQRRARLQVIVVVVLDKATT